ncbi:MAG: response regulator [Elusimicrobiaceae bacterium]|nr:response regulator [Elusimicrobiaceae bacterium]
MPKRLIVVDDAPIVRLMLKDILTRHGYQVIAECANGEEGVNEYKKLWPDAVTMDITMPVKDGIAALEEILAVDPNARVVMVTAIEEREYLMKAIKLGAVDYIVKPFEEERVVAAIENALSGE